MHLLNRGIALLLIAVLTLIGCGGGGDSAPPATTLSGTAAVGAPIVNGAVTVTCAAGAAVSGIPNTSATGAWSVSLSGQTLPCAVQVAGGTISGAANTVTYQSIANAYGTVNVTPLTGLVVANLAGAVTALTQTQLAAFNTATTPLATQLNTALVNLRTTLGLTALNTINPITTAFNPASGVVMDDILSALQTAMNNATVTYANLLAAAGASPGAAITLPAGLTTTALNTAYAGTTSGGGGTGGGTTPTVTGFSPATGAVGTTVTITGTNLVTAFPPAPLIKFDALTANVTGSSNTSMTVIVPTGLALGAHTITIGGATGTPLNVGNFNVTSTGGAAPAAPTGVTATLQAATVINLSWTAVSGATAYNVYRSTTSPVDTIAGNRVTTPPIADTGFGDSGLTAATTYYYKVTAINATGESVGSAEVSAVTNAAAGANTSAPTGLTATVDSITNTQVNLSWNAVPGATQYIVYRSTTSGMAALLASNALTITAATTANLTGHSAATTYYYAVQTTTPSSVASAEVSATTGSILNTVTVTTLAGTGYSGNADGTGTAASFSSPTDIAVDKAGNLYVADHHFLQQVRKITSAGLVSKLPRIVDGGVQSGTGITVDDAGNLYVTNGAWINKVTPAGVVSTLAGSAVSGNSDGTGAAASFNGLYGITVDSLGNAYVADRSNHTIRKIDASGVVTTLAGSAGVWGNADGTGTSARFNNPNGVALDSVGNLYVTDGGNNTIRKITPAGVVSTLAGGTSYSWQPVVDGTGTGATFWQPHGISIDSAGNLYVTDSGLIRKITPNGVVTTLAGRAGVGNVDGTGATAKFNLLNGITVDSAGNLYVVDRNNNTIRKIQQ